MAFAWVTSMDKRNYVDQSGGNYVESGVMLSAARVPSSWDAKEHFPKMSATLVDNRVRNRCPNWHSSTATL